LILNRSFLPIGIESARNAILAFYKGRAHAVDPQYRSYTWDEWVENTNTILESSEEGEYAVIHTPRFAFVVPYVFRLIDHDQAPQEWKIKFSRYHILIRDGFTCQYCAVKLPRHELTIDHIVPRSKGGGTTWENCVAACRTCNRNKADRTPEEANLVLLKNSPSRMQYDLRALLRHKKNKQWANFI
jgi:5-methylcytosine-specific restriction endonuclease McrA